MGKSKKMKKFKRKRIKRRTNKKGSEELEYKKKRKKREKNLPPFSSSFSASSCSFFHPSASLSFSCLSSFSPAFSFYCTISISIFCGSPTF